ncbi:MAG: cytochrome c biogenesis CcdA family protein [Candidatus Poriferisodalaceae bacterium]|nr:MAG: cytochrome C biogenesis protein [Acidimicrobiales bacterium MED-G01]|tara:strand:+ start:425 stop:1285 length:861 start_codon:yes stop_codon:yes gene_type:complete
MSDVNLAFAFTAGIVATINPCGFAMLPAYISYFLGIEANSSPNIGASITRALVTGTVVSSGFLIVFGSAGLLISLGFTAIREIVPWVAICVGLMLIVLGCFVTAGRRIDIVLPKFDAGTSERNLRSLVAFGVSYAVASISCGLPTFIVVVSTSVTGFRSGLTSFILYACGMSVTLLALTVSLSLARSTFLERLRALVRYVDRGAGVLMVAAGAYLVIYWVLERTGSPSNWFVALVEGWSSNLSNAVNDVGGVRTGVLLSVVVALGLLVWLLQSNPASSDRTTEEAK